MRRILFCLLALAVVPAPLFGQGTPIPAPMITAGATCPPDQAPQNNHFGAVYICTGGTAIYTWGSDAAWHAVATGTAASPAATYLTQTAHASLSAEFALGADPNADRILFWDDSAGAFTYLTPGTGLTITATTIDAAVTAPGGSDTQLQYNNAGAFGGITGSGYTDPVIELASNVLSFGASPATSGTIRLPDSSGGAGTNAGIWGYETDDIGGEVPILRLTLNADDLPQITLGGYNNQRWDFVLDGDDAGHLLPTPASDGFSAGLWIGNADNRVNSLFVDKINPGIIGALSFGGSINATGAFTTDGSTGETTSSFLEILLHVTPPTDTIAVLKSGAYMYTPSLTGNTAIDSIAAFYSEDMHYTNFDATPENPYFLWYNGTAANSGVWRVNAEGIVAYYNPTFADYTPGATDYERIVTQWNTDVAEIGTEEGGTGTLRNLRLIGGGLEFGSTLVTPASSGTRFLCISTAGVVTSSATACSGT